MAGARITDSLTEYNNIKKGFFTKGLTNWFSVVDTDRPAIPAGFTIEIGGSVYQFAAEEVIDLGALAGAQRLYVVITVDTADAVSAEFSTTFPATFNTALNGWYDGADRYIPYGVYWDGAASWTSKYFINVGAFFAEDMVVGTDLLVGGNAAITGDVVGNSMNTANVALKIKELAIGVWNMDTTQIKQVDITAESFAYTDILHVCGYIQKDDLSQRYSLSSPSLTENILVDWLSNTIRLHRTGSGGFDNVNFDSTAISRGSLLVYYT